MIKLSDYVKEVIDKNRIATLAGTSTIASAKIRHVGKLIKNYDNRYDTEGNSSYL